MPLQNRVNPFGNILAVSERGACMGNRGILHDDLKNLRRYHQHKHWIICRLEAKNKAGEWIKREPMSPNTYTELFFLDEATALAAGHRPCWECSRPRYEEFVHYFRLCNPDDPRQIDDILHAERFSSHQQDWSNKKQTRVIPIDDLPPGTFITLEPGPQAQPYLVLGDGLYPWAFARYGEPIERPNGIEVTLLTPMSTVRALKAGYRPKIHPEPY
jgi:hypothetical protein